jgi:hypothetical protein
LHKTATLRTWKCHSTRRAAKCLYTQLKWIHSRISAWKTGHYHNHRRWSHACHVTATQHVMWERDLTNCVWNVMAHGDARVGKWRGNWRIERTASTLHTTSEHGVSSITTAHAHTTAASSRLNWRPPADLNGLVRYAERRNPVSARVPSHFNWPLIQVVLQIPLSWSHPRPRETQPYLQSATSREGQWAATETVRSFPSSSAHSSHVLSIDSQFLHRVTRVTISVKRKLTKHSV